ncbi:MAG: hypothetical protein IK083_06740 [Abditibacteriota bacterium]|nr:hypothetical protein [Abditibacteriota bacterium]
MEKYMYAIIISALMLALCAGGAFAVSIAKTVYPTDGVPIVNVLADESLGVVPDGKTDCSEGLQRAIDLCDSTGGGTVFLPVGEYLLKGSVHIPQGVTLRGDWQDPLSADKPDFGTVIIAKPEPLSPEEKDDTRARPLFTLSGNSGIIGLTVWYPLQSAEKPVPYGFTMLMDNVSCSTLRRITLINSYRGVSAEGKHELCQLEKLCICALDRAILMDSSTDVGYSSDIRISPDFWLKAAKYGCSSPEALKSWCLGNAEGLVMGWLDDETLSEIYIDGCKTGIHFLPKQFWGLLYEVHIRNCGTGILCENLNDWAGAVVSRGEIEGLSDAVICNSRVGMLKLCGMKIKGRVSGRRYIVNDADLSFAPPLTHGDYKKPASRLTVVETAGYSKKPIDISGKLQRALDRAASTGGVVYLPAGIYSLYKPIRVPRGVQLSGNAPIFIKDTTSFCGGTVILSYVNTGTAITLEEDAGINGLRVLYPAFDAASAERLIAADAPETGSVCIRGEGPGVYVTNSVITAAFTGIDFTGCDRHCIRQVFGVSYLSHIKAGGRDGHIEGVLANIHFTQRHCLNPWFDPEYADRDLSWMGLGAVIRDLVVRRYCTTFRLEGAENESLLNLFMYAPNHLLEARGSTGTLINVSSDFMYGYQLLAGEKSDLLVINSLRSCGGSIICSEDSKARILNRIAISYQTETDYDSAAGRTDEYRYTQKAAVWDCDTAEGLEEAVLTDDPAMTASGKAWYREGTGKSPENIVVARIPDTDISSCYPGGRLHMTIWVNDYHNLIWGSQIQIGSGKKQDENMLSWSLPVFLLHKGKNEIYLPFESANPTGDFDPAALNFIRIFAFYGANFDNRFAIDDIFACK